MTEALGQALFHSLWQCAGIAALLWIWLAATVSARTRYHGALAALLACFAAFLATAAWHLPRQPGSRIAFPLGPAPIAAFESEAADIGSGLSWLVPLWSLGVVFFQSRAAVAWLAVRRLSRRGVCAAPAEWTARLPGLAAAMRVSRRVAILESGLAKVPSVSGWIRPLILVPAGLLATMEPWQVEAILLHELAHIRRSDYLWNLAQTLIEGLLFHHPAIWWISGVIRAEREHCCDDLAAAASGRAAADYASALLALEQNRWTSEPDAATVAATGGNLMKRIHRLLHPRERARAGPAWAAIPLLLAAAGMLFAWQDTAPKSPYQLWADEDVKYLIEPAERAAFQRLRTDEERNHFIAQFWKRRDPTPATEENEFKEEYYRRIQYANRRFAQKGNAGWTTDRGRIYIMHGPPDEIESHPSGRGTEPPFDQWMYHKLEGVGTRVIFTFTDRNRDGNYVLRDRKP